MLLILSSQNLLSQLDGICSGVDFDVHSDGFICGDGDGEICLTYYPDFFDEDCVDQGYVWRVIYPTDEFVIINTGDFDFGSGTNNVTTILENDDYLVAADIPSITLCFEGNIIDPGVEFTFTYESADGTDVIETQTIVPDAFTTIAGTVSVSTAINMMNLLPVSQSETTRQQVLINGTLIVDQDYTFSNQSRILMGTSQSKIIVNSGVEFTIEDSQVSGCGSNWHEIRIESGGFMFLNNSTIREALTAVNCLSGSEFQSLRLLIEDCRRGIVANGADYNYLGNSFFTSQIFNCEVGIDLNDMPNTTIISGLYIANCDRGIECDNSDLTLNNSTIESTNIHGLLINGNTTIVQIISSNFSFCPIGIRAFDVRDLTVESNTSFFGNSTDIFRRGLPNDYTLVNDCTFDGALTANFFTNMFPGVSKIQNSSLGSIFGGIGNGGNVIAFGLGGGADHDITVQLNSEIVASDRNISYTNLINPSVSRNDFIVSDNIAISVRGGENANITYNSNIVAEQNGINVSSSQKAKINCNPNIRSNVDLSINGNCAESRVHDNGFNSSNSNLSYSIANGDIHAGVQILEGNTFTPTGDNVPVAFHNGNANQAADDQYLVNDNGAGQGSAYYPFFSAAFNEWFDKSFAANKECDLPPIINDPQGPKKQRNSSGIISNMSYINRLSQDGIQDELDYNAGLVLYKSLSELVESCGYLCIEELIDDIINSKGLSNKELASIFPSIFNVNHEIIEFTFDVDKWYRDNEGKYKDVIEFEKYFVRVISMNDENLSQLDKLREQLRDKQSELMAVYQNMENVYDNNNSLIIKDEINTLTQTLESITSAKNDYIISQIKNLRALNEGINVYGYESDDHMKRINTLNLNILESNGKEFSLSPKDSKWLSYIANACVDNVGNSKFAAQSLLNYYDYNRVDFSNNCETTDKNLSLDNEKEDKIIVWPNPASESVSVKLAMTNLTAKEKLFINIYDMQGQTVYSGLVNSFEDLKINTQAWSEGIYFIKDNHNTISKKIIILR